MQRRYILLRTAVIISLWYFFSAYSNLVVLILLLQIKGENNCMSFIQLFKMCEHSII